MTPGEASMEKRAWIKSGVVEEFDQRQVRLLQIVLAQIIHYYQHLYRTRPCYQYPLSLARLARLCHRSGQAVAHAIRVLANTVPVGQESEPPIFYTRGQARRNKTHRPYQIFLRKKYD